MSILDGLSALHIDMDNLRIPDIIAGTDNERLYRANIVGANQAVEEAVFYVRDVLLNPTDEQLDAIYELIRVRHATVSNLNTGLDECLCGERGNRDRHLIRVGLAAATGADQ